MSNTPTIEQMNEAIAVFMDMEKEFQDWRLPNKPVVYLRDGYWIPAKHLKFHLNWEWLMPVVRKIYDVLADMLKKRPPHTACHGDMIEVDIHCAIREVNILKAHGFVYQFCEWYNNQKEATNANNP